MQFQNFTNDNLDARGVECLIEPKKHKCSLI